MYFNCKNSHPYSVCNAVKVPPWRRLGWKGGSDPDYGFGELWGKLLSCVACLDVHKAKVWWTDT